MAAITPNTPAVTRKALLIPQRPDTAAPSVGPMARPAAPALWPNPKTAPRRATGVA